MSLILCLRWANLILASISLPPMIILGLRLYRERRFIRNSVKVKLRRILNTVLTWLFITLSFRATTQAITYGVAILNDGISPTITSAITIITQALLAITSWVIWWWLYKFDQLSDKAVK